ncbi:MAG: endonuclease/exonuclease/phosphatase family protein [Bacteroidaceae bacterium]|nr:endonuclease/exonuclease/phosphatase family protein [Bacteroidaceae bacterium]
MKKLFIILGVIFFYVTPMNAGSPVRVLQFNIRIISDKDGNNNWYYRCKDIVSFCRNVCPDVIGMQELTVPQRTYLMDCLPNYACVGLGRDGGQTGEHSPVFYLKEKYILENSGTFWLSETPDRVSKDWDAACRHVFCWTILRNRQTGERFFYANTHFDHVSELARDNSALLSKRRLTEYAQGLPVIVTGDFNCNPMSNCYALMLNTEGTIPLCDAWNTARIAEGMIGTYHGWGGLSSEESHRIDFIFTSPDINVLRIVSDDYTRRPRMLSDHNPVYADIILP